jgi:PncC family amidohydrolase
MSPRLSEAELLARLRAAGARLATAESCTGGQVASRLTQVPGSSEVYWGGWVTYDNSAKTSQLAVPARLIETNGAVSREVAVALAEGGLVEMRQAGSLTRGVCVATTGVAGPGGGTSAKPVGLCFVALAATGIETRVREVRAQAGQDRLANQHEFADAAFKEIEGLLEIWP